eukprot:Skav226254  [mRNA]  locus=scaffold2708:65782:72610:- [translate_table: standard]
MAPPALPVQSLLEPAGASSDRIASPWRGRDRSSSPRPDPVSAGAVPSVPSGPTLPMTPTSPLSPGMSPGRKHYPNVRAEKHSDPILRQAKRSTCSFTPSVVPPWMLPGVKPRMDRTLRAKEMESSWEVGHFKSNTEKTVQRAFNIFNVADIAATSRKGRLGLHSRSLPPEVFGAAPDKVEAAQRPRWWWKVQRFLAVPSPWVPR